MKKKKGFLVIAHSSRRNEANQQVFTLVRRLRDYFQSGIIFVRALWTFFL